MPGTHVMHFSRQQRSHCRDGKLDVHLDHECMSDIARVRPPTQGPMPTIASQQDLSAASEPLLQQSNRSAPEAREDGEVCPDHDLAFELHASKVEQRVDQAPLWANARCDLQRNGCLEASWTTSGSAS